MGVVPWNDQKDGELTETNLRKKIVLLGYSVTRYVYPPGTYFSKHAHSVDKIDAVLEGRFKIGTPEGPLFLGPGDFVHVPSGMIHDAEVVGDDAVISLDAIRERSS